ncbi:MAG: glutamate--tRNA ligase [Candidatus Doudnabacteria bacterium]
MIGKKVRTRFAPSPTGYLHVGGLRTALFAYLFAKHNKGEFVLRIEDTDQARFIEGAIEKLINVLNVIGLKYDEGLFTEDGKIVNKGEHAPYLQSQRKDLYKEHAEKLVSEGHAYYCFCDEKRLDELRKEQEALKQPTRYDRKCRNLTKEDVTSNLEKSHPYVIRQAIPVDGQTVVKDLVFKDIVWDNKSLDDQVLMKSDGFPTYHLAVVVDDHLMEISHVIRGEEWIPSTPKHVLLYKAFGWEAPEFAHLPLLLNKDRSKLSKRQGDVAVEDYLSKGYLKSALINFIALLGWNPKTDQEIFTIEELIEQFDLAKVNKSGSIFDVDKLNWLNNLYIRKIPVSELANLLLPYLQTAELLTVDGKNLTSKNGKQISKEFLEAIAKIESERLNALSEIGERVSYFFEQPKYSPEILIWKKSDLNKTKNALQKTLEFIQILPDDVFKGPELEPKLKEFISSSGFDNGSVLWPLRVALSGLEKSPSPFEIMFVLFLGYGKFEILQRLEAALKMLE